jgi:carboxypeptidase Q
MIRTLLPARLRHLIVRLLLLAFPLSLSPLTVSALVAQSPADRLIDAALADSAAWNRLAELTDRFGPRLSGSRNLEDAIDWILAEMRRDGLENVRGEPVMVVHWERGEESAELIRPRRRQLPMLGLGNSVGTPPAGIEAEVLVVSSFDELAARAAEARGRIVLFDPPWAGYGQTVRYRMQGAAAAARLGAIAVLVRSVTPHSLATPHTGAMLYDSAGPRIPAAAVTIEDAQLLHRLQDRGERIAVRLHMGARQLPDARSRNVVAEIRGRERPDEVVVLGGHIDSWDVGQGAMDDGGGCVAAWEALRLMKALGLRPRRTVRVVMWTNEENGFRGARGYRDAHRDELDRHVLAIESDNGAFTPSGFAFTGSDSARARVAEIARRLARIDADSVAGGGGGADIQPLMELGVPGMSPIVDGSRYFWYHHSESDTMDKLDPRDLGLVTAALAVMAYGVADLPEPLPRAATAGSR